MAKDTMSVIDVAAWVSTTGKNIVETSRLVNIYKIDKLFLFKLHTKIAGREILVIEPGRRIHFSKSTSTPKEFKQDSVLTALRKYTRGGIVRNIQQLNNDRIVTLNIKDHKIIVELMKKGILALLDKESKIIVATEYRRMKDRRIKPKELYIMPPNKNPQITLLSTEELKGHLIKGQDLVRGLVRGLGLPGEFAEETVHRVGLDKNMKPSELDSSQIELLQAGLKEIYEEAIQGRGYVVYENETPILAVSFKPTLYLERDLKVEYYNTLDDALDVLYSKRLREPKGLEKIMKEETGRVLASIEKHRKLVEEYTSKSAELREQAIFMSQYYAEFEKILGYIKKLKEEEGWDAIRKLGWVASVDPSTGNIIVLIKDRNIKLNIQKKLDDILNDMYKLAGELEGKARRAQKSLQDLEKMLTDAKKRAVRRFLRGFYRNRRRAWYEKYIWSITRNGFLVIAGKNADQNESIVKRYLEDNDVFLHAEIHGAPATIMKTGGKEPTENDIWDASILAASYSRAWKAGAGYVNVFWVKGSQVSKSPPAGEYISKGAFMIYGKKNYVRGVRLTLAFGLEPVEDCFLRVLIGSEEAVSRKSWLYVTIVPGDNPMDEFPEVFKRNTSKLVGNDCLVIESYPSEELTERLPGRFRKINASLGKKEYRPPFQNKALTDLYM
ncbi:MAG: NFACT family protein [Desulfurococcales archaeon]|nr:NFACT family protein [Desulfurococcales archaeon]